jgi:SRSO17 transposase
LDAEHWRYVREVPAATPVFTQPAAVGVPPWSGRGRQPTTPRLAPAAAPPQSAPAVADSLPATAGQNLSVAQGAQGPRPSQFVAQRVWESRDGWPGRTCWLLRRRHLEGREPRSYLSNAPADTPLLTLAQVAAARWVIEIAFETAKGETGLDEDEGRSWAGWHHHLTLALLAAAFLLPVPQDWGGTDAPGNPPARQPRAARGAPAPHLDAGRVAPRACRHPGAQRAGQALTHQTASPSAA